MVVMPRPVELLSGEIEQAERLARAHRDHQDARGGQGDDNRRPAAQVLIPVPLQKGSLERPQIDFVRPGAARLADVFAGTPPAMASMLSSPSSPRSRTVSGRRLRMTLAVDTAVNDDVRHMDSGWPVFARQCSARSCASPPWLRRTARNRVCHEGSLRRQ